MQSPKLLVAGKGESTLASRSPSRFTGSSPFGNSRSVADPIKIGVLVGPRRHPLTVVELDRHLLSHVKRLLSIGTAAFNPIRYFEGGLLYLKEDAVDDAVPRNQGGKRSEIDQRTLDRRRDGRP